MDPSEVLFLGLGTSAILWYRVALPASMLGADWAGVIGHPPGVRVVTGLVRGDTTLPRYDDYRIVILQQPWGQAWLRQINSLRQRGIKVLYEVDDYLHGVPKQKTHAEQEGFTKARLKASELCMRACDGLIVSTEYIGRRYAKFNPVVYVCKNGLDTGRYNLTRPERATCNVGWAGATGHMPALMEWLNGGVLEVMRRHEHTRFVSIGMPEFAPAINGMFKAERSIGIPFAPLECYPAAMCNIDIALAPAGNTAWYRAKSDLRWLEASALSIPTIADPVVYPEIEHGETGFHASTPAEMEEILERLVVDPDLRRRVGENAYHHLLAERTADIAAEQWRETIEAVLGEHECSTQLYGRRRQPQRRSRQ